MDEAVAPYFEYKNIELPQIFVECEGTGTIPLEGLFNTVTNWNIRGSFADGVIFEFKDGPDKTMFVGDEG